MTKFIAPLIRLMEVVVLFKVQLLSYQGLATMRDRLQSCVKFIKVVEIIKVLGITYMI